jgi:hypothetical protein
MDTVGTNLSMDPPDAPGCIFKLSMESKESRKAEDVPVRSVRIELNAALATLFANLTLAPWAYKRLDVESPKLTKIMMMPASPTAVHHVVNERRSWSKMKGR